MRVKVVGAGSVGNHLAHAARSLDWEVTVCDVDAAALERMKTQVYPARYGSFDDEIHLCLSGDAPRGGFDLICIGSPPDRHLEIALDALREEPRGLQVEKPLCGPNLNLLDTFLGELATTAVRAFVGYDHVVSRSVGRLETLIQEKSVGDLVTIDVEFREHWAGIFEAHPWLSGPSDSYLGHWERGGGASGEHSHALNLWQHLARVSGMGRAVSVCSTMDYVSSGAAEFDQTCMITLMSENGHYGRVIQDVVTTPAVKKASLQGERGRIECEFSATKDSIVIRRPAGSSESSFFEKSRSDDFVEELRHIENAMNTPEQGSPISIERGTDTMRVLAAAHLSAARKSWQDVSRPWAQACISDGEPKDTSEANSAESQF